MQSHQNHQIHVDEQLQEFTSMFSDFRITQEDLKERAEVLLDRVEDAKTRIQAGIQEVKHNVDTTRNVIYEDLKTDIQVADVKVNTRIDSLERHLYEQHDKLQTHVDKTHVNIVTSITDTTNVMQKNMNDLETSLQNHIDDAMLHVVKRTPTGI